MADSHRSSLLAESSDLHLPCRAVLSLPALLPAYRFFNSIPAIAFEALELHVENRFAREKHHIEAIPGATELLGDVAHHALCIAALRSGTEFLLGNKSDATMLAAPLFCRSRNNNDSPGLHPCAVVKQILDIGLAFNRVPHAGYENLDADGLATLPPARGEHLATTFGGHAGPEAMRLGPFPLVRLICSLHFYSYHSLLQA